MFCKKCGVEIRDESIKFCHACGTPVADSQDGMNFPKFNRASFRHDISSVWPEWQIEKQLGKGSYGVVYQVVRKDDVTNLETHAAVKVITIPSDASEADSLRSEGIGEEGSRTYFKRIVDGFVSEIRLMDSLKGTQNIVNVEDYKVVEKSDTIGWDIYIRMELLKPFNTYIQNKEITEDEVIKLGCDICSALEICAEQNIIHRDIKPENIFINKFGHFKLGDFGIARKLENSTGGLSQKGTFNYMAPEVAMGTQYGVGADIYSLGIVLYRLLNENRLPFLENQQQVLNPEERKRAVERRIRGEAIPAPCKASPEMADLILRACSFDPARRFASAYEMRSALMDVKYGKYVPQNNQSAGINASEPVFKNAFEMPSMTGSVSGSGSFGASTSPTSGSGSFGNNTADTSAQNNPFGYFNAQDVGVGSNTGNYGNTAVVQPAPKKKKTGLIIGIGVAVVVVIGVVLAIVLSSGSSSTKKGSSGSSSKESSSELPTVSGKYMLESMTIDGVEYGYEYIVEAGVDASYIEFKSGNKAVIYLEGDALYNCTYDESKQTITDETGDVFEYTFTEDSVTVEVEHMQLTFKK